jgi:hypothetical protein
MLEQVATALLASLTECKENGRGLCVFEQLVRIAPAAAAVERRNYCRVCHAPVLGETVENAPIYWHNCP